MKRVLLCALALFLMSSITSAANVDELVVKLVGADGHERARARQLLPREGAAALPALLPLLGNGDSAIAEATFDIVLDISNQSTAPGREVERRQVTDILMPLIATERSETQKLVGLRLLERLVPSGYDIAAIAKLFGETPLLRDRARTALERIGTEEARVALRAALADAPAEFQWGLLTSLYELRDEKSLPQARTLTKSSDWRVRSRAARCLTWAGNPEEAAIIQEVIKIATDEKSRAGAVDSLLRLAQTMARKPATQAAAREIYLEVLGSDQIVWREAALAGLGGVGDASCVGPLLSAADEKALAGKVVPVLLGVAELLSHGGDKEKAIQCCQKVIALKAAEAQVQQAVVQLKALGVKIEVASTAAAP